MLGPVLYKIDSNTTSLNNNYKRNKTKVIKIKAVVLACLILKTANYQPKKDHKMTKNLKE